MPGYWLHYREGKKLVGWDDFSADSDAAAVQCAARLREAHAAELWEGPRKIWTFAPLPERLVANDSWVMKPETPPHPEDESRHFHVCDRCGQSVDRRKLDDLFHHARPDHEPLPA